MSAASTLSVRARIEHNGLVREFVSELPLVYGTDFDRAALAAIREIEDQWKTLYPASTEGF